MEPEKIVEGRVGQEYEVSDNYKGTWKEAEGNYSKSNKNSFLDR
ncbi:hypothetical protein DDB_G0284949 [Dictyostelium discoideum AX4]|uniref:Uncharacterized protein n=1 Tax=Dictyostelium discoideum TaxID=44689 RepID=Q54NW8_DICDI|nr:hypothetical protein DDB_G0284949 [Dictyostelium discoideum AX4]EAL64938.1 hypothetical protein DDB_G0284949 [Dictyostelium discoideum AX4]|eukprot:XP_639949.1 hypothetical protein DDB_G0284949 [Dictyostelium discoideum AX4]